MAKPKKKNGAPSKYNESFHPQDFIDQSKRGRHVIQIASSWDIHKDTLYEWAKVHPKFSDAFKLGRQHANAFFMNLGFAAMTNQASINGQKVTINYGFFQYMTKSQFGWDDSPKPEAEDFELVMDFTKYEKAKT